MLKSWETVTTTCANYALSCATLPAGGAACSGGDGLPLQRELLLQADTQTRNPRRSGQARADRSPKAPGVLAEAADQYYILNCASQAVTAAQQTLFLSQLSARPECSDANLKNLTGVAERPTPHRGGRSHLR